LKSSPPPIGGGYSEINELDHIGDGYGKKSALVFVLFTLSRLNLNSPRM
jgi:hypothetical protein